MGSMVIWDLCGLDEDNAQQVDPEHSRYDHGFNSVFRKSNSSQPREVVPMMSDDATVSLFKDLGSVELLANKLHTEEYRIMDFVEGAWECHMYSNKFYGIPRLP